MKMTSSGSAKIGAIREYLKIFNSKNFLRKGRGVGPPLVGIR